MTKLHMPGSQKRKPPGRPRHIKADHELRFFRALVLLWGRPEIGKENELTMQRFRNPEFKLGLKNVKPWLKHSVRGQQFVDLAHQHQYMTANMGNLYRRYVNWYFHNEATNGKSDEQATLRSDRERAG